MINDEEAILTVVVPNYRVDAKEEHDISNIANHTKQKSS